MAFADNGEFNQSFSEECWDIYKGPLFTRVKDRLTWFLNIDYYFMIYVILFNILVQISFEMFNFFYFSDSTFVQKERKR